MKQCPLCTFLAFNLFSYFAEDEKSRMTVKSKRGWLIDLVHDSGKKTWPCHPFRNAFCSDVMSYTWYVYAFTIMKHHHTVNGIQANANK